MKIWVAQLFYEAICMALDLRRQVAFWLLFDNSV
jgi:hypothetical protein